MGAGRRGKPAGCVSVTMQTVAKAFLLLLFVPQNVFSGEKYGAVTLLTSYRRSDQRLRVEVLNAVNLLPMDSNGKTVHRGIRKWFSARRCDRP